MTKQLITANAKYVRMSPRKVRLVSEAIKKLKPAESLIYLKNLNKRAVQPLTKTIKSAIANAENNYQIKSENLTFAKILVEPGPILKRWQPISRGRAHPINKRTSHIKVILEAKEEKKSSKK